ncbi:MAG TPA: Maf family protein [Terriglobales bacterium]|nr:Maf family protein [Terriglobales bacterium]
MLILASASPRRQELLRNAGIEFLVQPSEIPEVPLQGEAPQVFAERVAREKARTVYQRNSGAFVLSADTVVIVDEHILNKPEDALDAARMLRMLSGRGHLVTTAVCLIGPDSTRPQGVFEDVRCETTRVTFNSLTHADIESYIATGEPMDKAGAYGIQGIASRWIPRIEGDYFNVVGLPVALVYRMLREHKVL